MKTKIFLIKILIFFNFFIFATPCFCQLISLEQEIQLGKDASAELINKYGLVNSPEKIKLITDLGNKLTPFCERPELPFTFNILNTDEVNALSLPGGIIFVTKGLLDFNLTNDELACVIAHEIAHIAKRHSINALEKNMGFAIIIEILTGGKAGKETIYQLMQLILERGYSRVDEFEADELGATYAFKSGIDPNALISFLQKLLNANGEQKNLINDILSTHPYPTERIERLQNVIRVLKYG